jgi:hypothetical protein
MGANCGTVFAVMDEGVEAELTPVRLVRDGKVIAGRDGWLFLSGDRNSVLSQHSGELSLDDDQLKRWAALLARRRELLAERGIAYVFMVAPDTHSIYPDKLPEGVEHSENRPVIQLRDHLAAERSQVPLIYPLGELTEARNRMDVCSRTDSHWNDFGTFVVYSRLMDEVEKLVPVRRVREDDLVLVRTREIGDLGFKVDGREPELLLEAAIPDRRAKLVRDNRVEGSGSVVSTARRGAPGSCVLMADSYGWWLFKYVAESFGRLTYVYQTWSSTSWRNDSSSSFRTMKEAQAWRHARNANSRWAESGSRRTIWTSRVSLRPATFRQQTSSIGCSRRWSRTGDCARRRYSWCSPMGACDKARSPG